MTGLIKLERPTGFIAASPVDITKDGELFYIADKKRFNGFAFNLPAGTFEINGLARQLNKPWNFDRVKAPKAQKRISAPYQIEYIDHNPSKGTIDHQQRTIFLDKSLLNEPRHIREFVILHELAHKKYFDELYCDISAAKQLLKKGYNPEQATEGRRYLSGRNNPISKKLESLF